MSVIVGYAGCARLTFAQVKSNFQQTILPTHTFKHPPKDLEVLLVPGGLDNLAPPPEGQDIIDFIKEMYPRLRYIISVCSGATLLARAGVLDGKRATTNKSVWGWAILQGPRVNWVPKARWVVDGNIWTTSGVAVRLWWCPDCDMADWAVQAGMDGMLGFVEYVYGTDFAWLVANSNEYAWNSDPSWDPYSAIFNVTGA